MANAGFSPTPVPTPMYYGPAYGPSYTPPGPTRQLQSVPGQYNNISQSYNTPGNTTGQGGYQPTVNTGGGTNLSGMNPAQQTDWAHQHGFDNMDMYYNSLRNNAQSSNQGMSAADIADITAQYDSMAAAINQRRTGITNAFNTGLDTINSSINQQEAAAGLQKADLQRTGDLAQNQAYQNYQTSQRMNREAARAAGGGESSAYLDQQGQTNNSYGQTQANISMDQGSRLQNLDQQLTNMHENATNQKAELVRQYNDSMQKVALDENATDNQKIAAIGKIRAQYNAMNSNIDMQLAQMQNQMKIAMAQIAAYGGNIGSIGNGFTVGSMATNTPSTNYGSTGSDSSVFSGLNLSQDQNKKLSAPGLKF